MELIFWSVMAGAFALWLFGCACLLTEKIKCSKWFRKLVEEIEKTSQF